MNLLPEHFKAYKRTPHFTHESIPAGLLKAHATKSNVWGTINLVRGELLYRILEPDIEEVRLTVGKLGIIEPTVKHEVQPLGDVEFYVEFYR